MNGGLVSPDEMIEAAKKDMLDGREPASIDDWARVMNYCAFNVQSEVASSACKLIARIYNMPLTDDLVENIVQFQLARRRYSVYRKERISAHSGNP
jgi:hypothetical protein